MNITQKDNLVKYCKICDCELIIGINWTRNRNIYSDYRCSYCCTKAKKEYRNKHPGYDKQLRDKNPEKKRISDKKYRESYKGIIADLKHQSKRRGLGSNLLFENPFPKDILVHKHHISSEFVVYIPKSLHGSHLHGKYTQLHMNDLKPYVEGIYNISYIIEDGD